MASVETRKSGGVTDLESDTRVLGWLNGSGGNTVHRLDPNEGGVVSVPGKQGVSEGPLEPSWFCFRRFNPVERVVDPEVAEEQLKKDLAALRGLQNQGNESHPLAVGLHRLRNLLKGFRRPSPSTTT